MEFGRVDPKEIPKVDFTLPADSAFTKKVLAGGKKSGGKAKVYVGCAKWGRKEWVGSLYPKGTKDAQFLDHYVRHFNSIELNATHYKIYDPAAIGKWAAKAAGKDFIFCPKMAQEVTHFSDLVSPVATQKTDRFLEGILAFGPHLGPIFVQVSDRFSPLRKANLYAYLKTLPRDLSFFLELRHPDWFSDAALRREWLELLNTLGIGVVITDATGRRDCAHMEMTVPRTFIRFVGNGLHPTDYKRIDEWAARMADWLKKGLQELYFFMHQHDETHSPQLCDYVIEQFNSRCGTDLSRVNFVGSKPNSLF